MVVWEMQHLGIFGFGVYNSDKYVVVDDSGIDVLPIELNPLGFNWLDEYFIANSCHLFPIFKNFFFWQNLQELSLTTGNGTLVE